MFAFIVAVVVLCVIVLSVLKVGRRCSECGSRLTYTYTEISPDASHPSKFIHDNTYRVCLRCKGEKCVGHSRRGASGFWW